MLHNLDLILEHKKKITNFFKKLRNKYVKTIYQDLIKKKSVRDIHKDIRKITETYKNKDLKLENYMFRLATFSKKHEDLDFFMIVHKKNTFNVTNKIAFERGNDVEADGKDLLLNDILRINRLRKRIFYISSGHSDCAKDHKDWQNKIYIDENWQNYVDDENLKAQITQYVIMNNVKTYQWVIGKPVWLVTRPNCRHYFKALEISDVLGHNVQELVRNHKMYRKKGGKNLTKSIYHDTRRVWYTKDNMLDIIQKYEERLEFHKVLYSINKRSQDLKRAIEKDRLLIRKWKQYYEKLWGNE